MKKEVIPVSTYDTYCMSNGSESSYQSKHYDALLKMSELSTPLGTMLAIADDTTLYLLEFVDRRTLDVQINRLKISTKAILIPGKTEPIILVERELKAYFDGILREFKTPVALYGSAFQKQVWSALRDIPYGQTYTYSDIAALIDKPLAVRAVAHAIASNSFAIVIACHRVISKNGNLAGYAGGIERKKWLINHEKQQILHQEV